MNWDLFDMRGEDKRKAFETLAGQLFERWCRRTFGSALRDVRFVEGSGGDGGVEAYALLTLTGAAEPDVVGLQAKWFRSTLGKTQFKQIDHSFRTALRIRGVDRLKRYCVAIPRRLNDERRGTNESQRARWNEWVSKAKAYAPNTIIELWDDARLETELSEPENEGLSAHWFTHNILTIHDLTRRFEAARAGWLSNRYLPDLHAVSQLENDLALRLGASEARIKLLRQAQSVVAILRSTRDGIAHLPRYREFMALADAPQMLELALDTLDRQLDGGEALMDALRRGRRVDSAAPEGNQDDRTILQPYQDFQALRPLHQALNELDRKARLSHAPTHEITRQLARCLGDEGLGAMALLHDLGDSWQRAPTWVAYTGPPGVGKTHAMAHAVEERLDAKLPAVLLRAKDCPLDEGWAAILRSALDRPPGARLGDMWNAMEATAVRADIQRARAETGTLQKSGVEIEPTSFLLAIDGLEEGGRHPRWAELLGELHVHLRNHPRLRVAVTLRTTSRDAILGKVRRDRFEEQVLSPGEDDIQQLLRRYCQHYDVELPDRRLRWALREPLSVRLYCDLKASRPARGLGRHDLSLPALLGKKLDLAEDAISEQGGFGRHDQPLRTVLDELARACIEKRYVSRDDAIALARKAMPAVDSVERWSWVLDQAEAHGLLLAHTHEPDDPTDPRPSFVEPAYEPLTDYLIAKAAAGEIARAIEQRDACTGSTIGAMPRVLRTRPDACTQTAILLASRHRISLVETGVFRDALSQDQIDRLELRAIAALEGRKAARYRDWVLDRLRASMPSCRRVLKELCIPVARDLEHPFAPRFVHEALLPFQPAKRDLFWSGPSRLPGGGAQPWEGWGDEALEHLSLEPDDPAEGPPLLLAWALTSVDNRWRRQVRAELAQWGAKQLDELVRWLDLTTQSNDPQMIEDVTMAAFGAACLAGADPRLGDLVRWVDENLLALDSPRRQENIVVLHAARGIVERAQVMGIAVDGAVQGRARSLYRSDERLLEIDVEAAREADDHDGIRPITSDLAWYVVPISIEPFFGNIHTMGRPRLDPTAAQLVATHAECTGLSELSPQRFAFASLMAYLHAVGWNEDAFYGDPRGGAADERLGLDVAIVRRYHPATHGARSSTSSIAEKYIWTGCHMLQAYLAGRLPVGARSTRDTSAKTAADPALIARLEPNPATDMSTSLGDDPWSFFVDKGLIAPIPSSLQDQLDRANEWVRKAPNPDMRPWLVLPRDVIPAWAREDEWVTLHGFVLTREPDSQADSILRIGSAIVPTESLSTLHNDIDLGLRLHREHLYGNTEGISGGTYVDPREALWAPWARGVDSVIQECSKDGTAIELLATTAAGMYLRTGSSNTFFNELDGEHEIRFPAFWLRRALALVDAVPVAEGSEWRFLDRAGQTLAVYTDLNDASGTRAAALLIRRSSLQAVLAARGQSIVWGGWLHRRPNPSLVSWAQRDRYVERQWRWLGFLTTEAPEIVTLKDDAAPELDHPMRPPSASCTASPSPPPPAPPLVPVGPVNPDVAVPLSSDLDRDDAIPYFLWDDPIPVRELRHRLATAAPRERDRLLGKILREARDSDVWKFTMPDEVARRFGALKRHLGRRRPFWEFLLNRWHKEGLLAQKPA